MDYNAMLVPLYKNSKTASDGTSAVTSDLDPTLLHRPTGKYNQFFSDAEVNRVKYLAISRSSNLHSCKPKFKFYFGTTAQDFLGVSLLDENLERIEGTDIAVNVDKWLLGDNSANFFDFQIVAVRSTKDNPLKDQLFLFASGHTGTYSFPIDIRRIPPVASSNHNTIPWNSKVKGQIIPLSQEYQYGYGFQVRFVDDPGRFNKFKLATRPDRLFQFRGVDRGKNFHIFESSNGETFMEAWPHGFDKPHANSHFTIPINLLNLFPGRELRHGKGKRAQVLFQEVVESKNGTPKHSFKNATPKHERPNVKFRGTSQIIDMVLVGRRVKVGISHTVSEELKGKTYKRVYLSQFYAFLPDQPFNIIALSGHFCFNHMHENDVGYSAQWISERPTGNRTAPILVLSESFRCPAITFASGITDMIGHDGNHAIITYGWDDCYSRSIIVSKIKMEALLVGWNSDMQ